MRTRLQDKVALVTGGTSGIGAGTVKRLAYEGARVIFTGSNRAAAERVEAETGAKCYSQRVEDAAAWPAFASAISEHCGRLDIVFVMPASSQGTAASSPSR